MHCGLAALFASHPCSSLSGGPPTVATNGINGPGYCESAGFSAPPSSLPHFAVTMRTTWNFHTASQLHFGPGAVELLPEILRRQGAQRVLLVTDPALIKAGIAPAVRQLMENSGTEVTVFEDGVPEPPLTLGDRCAERARSAGVQALVAVGGGSNMDLAKIAAVLLAHGGQARDYVGDDVVPGPVAPLICLPTTAGTGSEVSGSSVLTDTDRQMKVGILSNHLRPAVALVDPKLTLTCPRQVTADSGIDALSHAIEAYTAVENEVFPLPAGERSIYQGRNPMGDMVAEQAIRLVAAHLRRAVAEPGNLAAREGMALAATLGGLAFSNVGVAAVHALEYPLGGELHCSHGAGNGLLLPFVMQFNLPARAHRFAQIATWLGESTAGLEVTQAAGLAIRAVEQLKADIGIPARLRDLGATRDQLPGFARKAFAVKRILRVNPRPVTEADLLGILEAAY